MNEKFKHHYKKEFGQHFLLNPQMHEKIVNFVKKEIDFNESETLNVFEIGPGAGHLSGAILKHLKPRNFIMIEKDFDLQNHLIKTFDLENEAQKSFSKHDGESCIKLIFEDAMRVDFENLIFSEMKINKEKEKICLIANLPYNIATKLLIDLFEIQSKHNLFDIITVLVQKEVASRFLCHDGGKKEAKNYGKTGILSKLIFENVLNHFDIGPKNFTPPPKVDSTLISFVKNENLDTHNFNFGEFLGFLNSSFCFPRKMLINNLKNFKNLEFNQLEEIFDSLQISKTARPSELKPEKYFEFFQKIQKILASY